MPDHRSALTEPLRFGVFEIDPPARELRKHGVRIKLQDQPFAVLLILLEKPGQVVTKEELQQRLWPADTFVEFDKGIYNAMKRLRETLGDEAETPRYIETLPRRGYRFIAPVENPGAGVAEPDRSAVLPSTSERTARFTSAKRLAFLFSFLGFLVVAALSLWLNLRSPLPVPRVIDSVQITKDERPKEDTLHFPLRLLIDGSRLYFTEPLPEGAAL